MKFGPDQKFELKKSIKLWQWPEQKLLKILSVLQGMDETKIKFSD
jgi:hypothetical protein